MSAAGHTIKMGSGSASRLFSTRTLHSVTGVPRHQALWHLALSRKYERAARSPWLPVAPDPPNPSKSEAPLRRQRYFM